MFSECPHYSTFNNIKKFQESDDLKFRTFENFPVSPGCLTAITFGHVVVSKQPGVEGRVHTPGRPKRLPDINFLYGD